MSQPIMTLVRFWKCLVEPYASVEEIEKLGPKKVTLILELLAIAEDKKHGIH